MSTTIKEFRRLAEKRMRQINPSDVDFEFEWKFTSDGFVPDRLGGGATMYGRFEATAPGYRSKTVMATMEKGAKDVTLR